MDLNAAAPCIRPTLLLSAIACLLLSHTAQAHRVNADARVSDDGGAIRVEAWLSGGTTPKQGAVIVLRPDGKEVLRGALTDGAFEFRPDRRERFTFVVQLGEGHAKTFELADAEFARLRAGGSSDTQPSAPTASGGPPTTRPATYSTITYDATATVDSGTTMRVLVGLAAIAAVVALAVALSASKRIRRIEARLGLGEEKERNDEHPSR